MKKSTGLSLIVLFLLAMVGVGDNPAPREFKTHHRLQIGNEALNYTAVAGEIILKDAENNPQASVFSISYMKESVSNSVERPLTFVFNGGPGSSAVWLHLGAFGPKRLALSSDAVNSGSPPYRLEDNSETLLRYTDLVFVDPVGTGYSRALGKKKDADYWGVDEDGNCIADFIRQYLVKYNRWNSPLYLRVRAMVPSVPVF